MSLLKDKFSNRNPDFYKRILRSIGLIIILIIIILLIIDLFSAWLFINELIYPVCLKPSNPFENHKPEEYLLRTKDGIMIQIWYFPSKNGSAIIELGGLTGSLGAQTFPVEELLDKGFGIVEVGSRACTPGPTPVTLGGNEIYDGEAALQFLLNRTEIFEDHIGVMGFSSGGATAIRLAVENPEINAVVRDGGFANLEVMLNPPEEENILIRFYRKTLLLMFQIITGVNIEGLDLTKEIAKLSPTPILLIYGTDEVVSGVRQYESAHDPKELWIVPGGGHGSNYSTAKDEYASRILDFFNKTLVDYIENPFGSG